MTSSRFPIGVAQTASGTATQRLERDQAGADQARLDAELGAPISSVWPAGASASRSTAARAAGSSSSTAATPKPPPITTRVGPKTLTSEPIATPRWWPISLERRMALLDEVARGRVGPEQPPREPVGGAARAVRLDVAAPRARALARLPVLDDHHVAELGPAAKELAAEDDAAADARAEREQHEVARAAAGAEPELGERRAARVVLDPTGRPSRCCSSVAERHVASGMLTAPSAMPVRWSIRDGMPKPTASIPSCGSSRTASTSASRSAACEVVGVGRSTVSSTLPVGVDDPGQDLRPAEVDADDALRRSCPAGNLTRRMAPEEKPYRVYRGGRAKGKVPRRPRAGRAPRRQGRRAGDGGGARTEYRGPARAPAARKPSAGAADRPRRCSSCSC